MNAEAAPDPMASPAGVESAQPSRRLLFLLPFPPRLDGTHGGCRVMAQLLSELSARHRIAILYLRGADELPVDEAIRNRCDHVEEVARPFPVDRAMRWMHRGHVAWRLLRGRPSWVSNWAVKPFAERVRVLARTWRPDAVHLEYHIMGQYLPALKGCPAPRILTQYEPGIMAARDRQREAGWGRRLISELEVRAWRGYERAVMEAADAVIVFTDRDREVLMPLAGSTPVVTIPFGTQIPDWPLGPPGSRPESLLFVGNFIHPPNSDAAAYLIRSILPRVLAEEPELTLQVVGSEPPAEVRALASERVVVTGLVPDVTPYLERAAVVVMPLRLGGGMRVKALEALAAGKAVVASPLAVEGLPVTDGEQVVLARSADQFAAAIVRLVRDPERRIALGTRAHQWARANLGWQSTTAAYGALYESLGVPCRHAGIGSSTGPATSTPPFAASLR